MTKIIPTNFALSIDEFKLKLNKLEFSKKLHIDYMDGIFTKNKSINFNDLKKFKKELSKFECEIHLMTYNPIKYLNEIIELNIKKILIHFEVFNNINEIENTIEKFKKNNIKIFIVLNPNTEINKITPIIKSINGIMLMSVIPGAEKQKFIENIFNKIIELNKIIKSKNLENKLETQIDGGINSKNIIKLKKLNVNILSIGSAISNSKNPKLEYLNLLKL